MRIRTMAIVGLLKTHGQSQGFIRSLVGNKPEVTQLQQLATSFQDEDRDLTPVELEKLGEILKSEKVQVSQGYALSLPLSGKASYELFLEIKLLFCRAVLDAYKKSPEDGSALQYDKDVLKHILQAKEVIVRLRSEIAERVKHANSEAKKLLQDFYDLSSHLELSEGLFAKCNGTDLCMLLGQKSAELNNEINRDDVSVSSIPIPPVFDMPVSANVNASLTSAVIFKSLQHKLSGSEASSNLSDANISVDILMKGKAALKKPEKFAVKNQEGIEGMVAELQIKLDVRRRALEETSSSKSVVDGDDVFEDDYIPYVQKSNAKR